MTNNTLQLELIAFLLAVMRLGGFFVNLPGFSGKLLPGRIRTLLAASLAFVCLGHNTTAASAIHSNDTLIIALFFEFLVGYSLGFMIQLWLSCLSVAGALISAQTGLMNVFASSHISDNQDSLYSEILGAVAVFIIIIADLHLSFLKSLVDSYKLFPPLTSLEFSFPIHKFSEAAMDIFSRAFMLSLQLASPFIILSLMVSLAAGLINRLMPSFQVFFVTQPLQILLGLLLLSTSLPIIIHMTLETLGNVIPTLGSTS